jgi:cyclophilin family peptidyl-prolyl cis-trans isomerase
MIDRSDGFVIQTGDPSHTRVSSSNNNNEETVMDPTAPVGYVPSDNSGQGPHGERLIPLEIFIQGDNAPIYETTIEDTGRGGQAVVLPFSSYGAMGWARDEYDPNSGSSQFFWLLFDSDLTPAGKNVLDGRYPWYVALVVVCFLYNTSSSSSFDTHINLCVCHATKISKLILPCSFLVPTPIGQFRICCRRCRFFE